jgi:hypothetical protein
VQIKDEKMQGKIIQIKEKQKKGHLYVNEVVQYKPQGSRDNWMLEAKSWLCQGIRG